MDTANPGLVETKNVETVSIRALGDVSVNGLLMEGVTSVVSSGSSGDLTVSNGSLAATYGVVNSISGQTADLSVSYRGTDVAGTADTAKLSIENVGSSVLAPGATSPTVTLVTVTAGTGVEAISLATAGTNYAKVEGNADVATLTVTGNGTNDLTIGTTKAALTLDASASTGSNVFRLGSSLTSGDVVKGGSGSDTVVYSAQTATVTMSGVETLVATGGTATTTFSANPGLTTLNIRTGDATTIAGVSTLSNLVYTGTGAATFSTTFGAVNLNTAFSGTADSLAVSLGNAGTTLNGNMAAGRLAVSGVENVSVTQADILATGSTTFAITNTGMKTFSVTTAGSLDMSASAAIDTRASTSNFAPTFTGTSSTTGSNTVTSVDFSGVAGATSGTITFQAGTFAAAATVKAAVGGSTFQFGTETASDVITVTGGAGVDSITTGTSGSYVVTLGGGATNSFSAASLIAATSGNTVNVTGGDGADTITGGANADVINGGAGNDIIRGGRGADTIDGGLGADTYRYSLGTIVSAAAEVQTITVGAGSGAVSDAAGTAYFNIGGTTVSLNIAANATTASIADNLAAAINLASGGAFSATSANSVVTVTWAANGNQSPTQGKIGSADYTTIGTAATDTGTFELAGSVATKKTTFAIATSTQGGLSTDSVASDSNFTAMDSLTFVSNADSIEVYSGSNQVSLAKATATAASAGNYGAVSSSGLYTLDSVNDVTLSATLTGIAANITAGTTVAGETVGFVFNGQAYLYISDGVNGYSANGDLVIALSGVSSLTNGITIASSAITVIG